MISLSLKTVPVKELQIVIYLTHPGYRKEKSSIELVNTPLNPNTLSVILDCILRKEEENPC